MRFMAFNFFRTTFNGDPNIGLLSRATEKVCLLGSNVSEKAMKRMEETLGVKVHTCTLAGTDLIGIFCSCNSNGIVVTKLAEKHELAVLKKLFGKVAVIDSKETAIGNLVMCNDNGCVISPKLKKFKEQIAECLGCKVDIGTLAGFDIVGSTGMASNVGCLCHSGASEDELKKVESLLKVRTDIGTVAYGTPYIKAGVIVNSKGIIISESSTGPELGRADEVFNPER